MIAEFFSTVAVSVRNGIMENPSVSLSDPRAAEELLGGSMVSEAGVRINHRTALTLAPVWQSVAMISGDTASMTLDLYRRLPEDDREIDRDHPAEPLVSVQANEETSAFEFWRRLMVHLLLWQDGYAWIDWQGRPGASRIDGLYNLLPDRTKPVRDKVSGKLFYLTEVDGKPVALAREEVLHVKGLSLECGKGCDLVEKARDSWGLALAAQGFASRFFSNGLQASGVLEVPATYTEKAAAKLEEGFRKKYTGKDQHFKVIVLREGAKFHSTQINAEQAQMHELREDQARDVARYFNLPPFKLGLQDSTAYNSSEHAQLVYLTSCLNHYRLAIASECGMKLLTAPERLRTHYFEHNASVLLELDFQTLNAVLETQRRNEIISANEWRRKINLPKRTDPGGDEYVNPNTRAKEAAGKPAGPDEPASKPPADRLRGSLRALLDDAVNRVARRVCFDARTAAKKPAKFLAWLDGRAAEHRKVFDEVLLPVLGVVSASLAGQPPAEAICAGLGGRFFADLLDRLSPLVEPPHSQDLLTENVERACGEFEAAAAGLLAGIVFGADGDKLGAEASKPPSAGEDGGPGLPSAPPAPVLNLTINTTNQLPSQEPAKVEVINHVQPAAAPDVTIQNHVSPANVLVEPARVEVTNFVEPARVEVTSQVQAAGTAAPSAAQEVRQVGKRKITVTKRDADGNLKEGFIQEAD